MKNEKLSTLLKGNTRRVGSHHSNQSKELIAKKNKGYRWYNNGHIEVKAKEKPEGFSLGRLPTNKNWYTNFETSVFTDKKPEGEKWIKGRMSYNEGRSWFNDGTRNFLLEDPPFEKLKSGEISFGIVRKKRQPTLQPTSSFKKIVNKPITVGEEVSKEPEVIKPWVCTPLETPLIERAYQNSHIDKSPTSEAHESIIKDKKQGVWTKEDLLKYKEDHPEPNPVLMERLTRVWGQTK